jgi:sugar lactone lactonase YvrE
VSRGRKLAAGGAALLALLPLVLLLRPAPIDPAAYRPPPRPALSGPLAPNPALASATLLARGRVKGPEDVAFDALGRLYAGTRDGRIVRLRLPDERPETFAATGGRPLGLRFDPRGNLLVCDTSKGLVSIDPGGRLTVLSTEAEGVPFRFTNNLDVARDGVVYFTDASSGFGQDEYLYDLLEARPHGRLLRYDPASRRTEVVLGGLYFANGVALSPDESFVLVNETYRYRITRRWLRGPRAGEAEVFADDLPGFPDNLDPSPRGTYWVALFTVRNEVVDALHPHPFAKSLLARLPRILWPKPAPYGLVVEVDGAGRLLRSFHDPEGRRVPLITTAREHDGQLYLGTLEHDWIGRFPLPAEPAAR